MATVIYEPKEGPSPLDSLAEGLQPGIENYFRTQRQKRVTEQMQASLDEYRQEIQDAGFANISEARSKGPSFISRLPSEIIANPRGLKIALDWQDRFLQSVYPEQQAFVDPDGNVTTASQRPEGSLTTREYTNMETAKAAHLRAKAAGVSAGQDSKSREIRRTMEEKSDRTYRSARFILEERRSKTIRKAVTDRIKTGSLDKAEAGKITSQLTNKIETYLDEGLLPTQVIEALGTEADDLLNQAGVSALAGGPQEEVKASQVSTQEREPVSVQLKPGRQTLTEEGEIEQGFLESIGGKLQKFLGSPPEEQKPTPLRRGRAEDVPEPPGHTTIGHVGETQVIVPDNMTILDSREKAQELVQYLMKEYGMSQSEAATFAVRNLTGPVQ